jgi:rhodanese-related sulfurtransferase
MPNRIGMIFFVCINFIYPFNTLANQFSTKPGLGFDKQISVWLVEKYITPQKKVIFFSDDTIPENTQLFDESDAVFMRTASKSTFELLVDHYKLEASAFKHLNKLTFDIEINLWMPDELPDSIAVEKAYRDLQEKWGRTNVPHQCYAEFFDTVERSVIKKLPLTDIGNQTKNLACWKDALHETVTSPEMIVPTISISTLLGHMNAGAKAVFIDVREPDEFAENHIPGAINLQIRDANQQTTSELKNYDVVVAYCIKDFRGFEMARKLRSLGVTQAVILNPYGIKGWIDSNLPVFQQGKVDETTAAGKLKKCIEQQSQCKDTSQ